VDGHEVTFQTIDSFLTNLTTPGKVSCNIFLAYGTAKDLIIILCSQVILLFAGTVEIAACCRL
jgi:hypothetical protein